MGLHAFNGDTAVAQTSPTSRHAKVLNRLPVSPPAPLAMPAANAVARKDHADDHVVSPVTQSGCFEFDRVIKSGEVSKRTRKAKYWKSVHMVLRPNTLSIYKDSEATKLRHQVILSDLTAVARQRDPKQRAQHVFGLFSPSRNYHLSADSDKEAQEWVETIRREARIDKEDEDMILLDPVVGNAHSVPAAGSSTEEPDSAGEIQPPRERAPTGLDGMHSSARRPSRTHGYSSSNDPGSYSDYSDPGVPGFASMTSLSGPGESGASATSPPTRPGARRMMSHMSGVAGGIVPEDRVINHGWLYMLKTHGGVRQWRTVWAVLRPKTFAIYKNEEEYSALLVVQFPSVCDAVEIDPLSKSKRSCFQLIAEEKTYRFSCGSENDLDRWLGAFKSLLAKRKEGQLKAGAGVVPATLTMAPTLAAPAASAHAPVPTA